MYTVNTYFIKTRTSPVGNNENIAYETRQKLDNPLKRVKLPLRDSLPHVFRQYKARGIR